MGSIGPQKSGRVARAVDFFSRHGPGEGVEGLAPVPSRITNGDMYGLSNDFSI